MYDQDSPGIPPPLPHPCPPLLPPLHPPPPPPTHPRPHPPDPTQSMICRRQNLLLNMWYCCQSKYPYEAMV